jgi:hypothetical protein
MPSLKSTTHIPQASTDNITMSAGGEGQVPSPSRAKEEANIRWLLAAVLHHQPEDDADPDPDAPRD